MQYVVGDATQPVGTGNKIICHIVNDIGLWGAGFVLALGKRYPKAEEHYKEWSRGNGEHFHLGATQFVHVGGGTGSINNMIWVANMVAQRGVKNDKNPKPLQLDALADCLMLVDEWSETFSATVHMPRIGCGLAGGKWEEVSQVIAKFHFADYTTVYDLEQ